MEELLEEGNMQELYLDANAHVSLSQAARNVYNNSLELGHPSSLNTVGRKSAALLEEARAKIAELIGAKTPNQIYFTSGCTQAAEWGISIVLKHFEKTDWNFCPTNILYSPIEHVAVRNVIEDIDFNHKQQGRDVCKVDSDGKLDIEYKHPNGEIFKFIDKNDCLICIHSHNEFGTIQDFSNIERKFLFSDLSQTLGKEKLNVTDLNVDLGIFGAHKFGGPTGVGFMYLKNPDIWEPFGTGGRYFLDRTGTPDVLGILATAEALEDALKTLQSRQEKMIEFHSLLELGLENRGARIIAKNANRLKNTTFVYLKDQAADKMLKMSEQGIHYGLGSACGSVYADISQSLKAIEERGSFCDYARVSSWGQYGKKEAERFLDIFDKVR